MSARLFVIAVVALGAPLIAKSPGPVQLLSCVVSGTGLLEAEVSNTSDFEQTCELQCDYVIREATVSQRLEVAIPARFSGRVGQFDTSSGRPGRYPGLVSSCKGRP